MPDISGDITAINKALTPTDNSCRDPQGFYSALQTFVQDEYKNGHSASQAVNDLRNSNDPDITAILGDLTFSENANKIVDNVVVDLNSPDFKKYGLYTPEKNPKFLGVVDGL